MNKNSEQLSSDLSLHIAQDEPLRNNKLLNTVIECIGSDICKTKKILGKKVIVVGDNKILLTKAVTYLGNPHPIFKKRMQLPTWYKDFAKLIKDSNFKYEIYLLGVYHYKGNIIFVNFDKEKYLNRTMHNSSAHIYINDLFQAMKYGVFKKIDANGNKITTIRRNKIRGYLLGEFTSKYNLFDLFKQFNNGFSFGEWLYALDIIKEMHENAWSKWQETEWAGWFLEYKFNKFTIDNNITSKMKYISQKKQGQLDFDIYFEEDNFYGDLKASDISKKETPANDKDNLIECIYQHDRFWYIIYEHETIKDTDKNGEAAADRVRYIKSIDSTFDKPETSYASRMKHSVKFMKMCIIELNRINFRNVLSDFNQGRQPNGDSRKVKFKINKNNIENFIVFRYTYNQ